VPTIRNIITTPYSVCISWEVLSIIFDNEMYSVEYGTNETMLVYASEVVNGNTDGLAISDVFSVNITGLTPFTTYYYIIWANNSIGNTSTNVMSFRTNEAGVCINNLHKIVDYYCTCTAPNVAPENFRIVGITATSIMFQWNELTGPNANGMVRNYIVSCLSPNDIRTEVSLTVDNIMNHSSKKFIKQMYHTKCTIMHHAKNHPRRQGVHD